MIGEPLEFQLDCAEDNLARIERLMSKLIAGLFNLEKQKQDTIKLIETLKFEMGC